MTPENEFLAKYAGYIQITEDGQPALGRVTFSCWQEDFEPHRFKFQAMHVCKAFKEETGIEMDEHDEITARAACEAVLKMKGLK